MSVNTKSTLAPSQEEIRLAREAKELLMSRAKSKRRGPVRLGLSNGNGHVDNVALPPRAFSLLCEIVEEMAEGNFVKISPIHEELTTQQAADILNVSRPYLVKLLDEGKIPSRKVGSHRRVLRKELMEYDRVDTERRHAIVDEMVQLNQEMGLY